MINAITLPLDTLGQIPPVARIAILESLGLLDGVTAAVAEPELAPAPEGTLRFSDEQIRSLLEGVNPPTRNFLEAMTRLGPDFLYSDVLKALNIPLNKRSDLGGVWAGLTKRIKTVMGISDAKLAKLVAITDWSVPERTFMEMHPETHAALRRVFSSGRPT